MKTIGVKEFQKALSQDEKNNLTVFLDIRTAAEYKESHIEGVVNRPLSEILEKADSLKKYEKIYLHCLSGTRCNKAFQLLDAEVFKEKIIVFEGGITAWEAAGLPLLRSGKKIPIIRQVMIVAGTLILTGVGLTFFSLEWGIYLSAFVGAGLLFSGLTGWCGMALLLSKMPWNK